MPSSMASASASANSTPAMKLCWFAVGDQCQPNSYLREVIGDTSNPPLMVSYSLNSNCQTWFAPPVSGAANTALRWRASSRRCF